MPKMAAVALHGQLDGAAISMAGLSSIDQATQAMHIPLAFTSNDEANALATGRFARVFGRREVFQLAPSKRPTGGASVPEEYLGRVIGIQPITFASLDERTRSGWRVASVSGGSPVSDATADGEFMPMVRVVDVRMAFLCRNDPIPSDGHVIGLAPSPDRRQTIGD